MIQNFAFGCIENKFVLFFILIFNFLKIESSFNFTEENLNIVVSVLKELEIENKYNFFYLNQNFKNQYYRIEKHNIFIDKDFFEKLNLGEKRFFIGRLILMQEKDIKNKNLKNLGLNVLLGSVSSYLIFKSSKYLFGEYYFNYKTTSIGYHKWHVEPNKYLGNTNKSILASIFSSILINFGLAFNYLKLKYEKEIKIDKFVASKLNEVDSAISFYEKYKDYDLFINQGIKELKKLK